MMSLDQYDDLISSIDEDDYYNTLSDEIERELNELGYNDTVLFELTYEEIAKKNTLPEELNKKIKIYTNQYKSKIRSTFKLPDIDIEDMF